MRSLYKEELEGNDKLEILDKYGIRCGTTDYADNLGAYFGRRYTKGCKYVPLYDGTGDYEIEDEKTGEIIGRTNELPDRYDCYASYFTQTCIDEETAYAVQATGAISSAQTMIDNGFGVRPVTTLKELSEITEIEWLGEELLKAGEFPNYNYRYQSSVPMGIGDPNGKNYCINYPKLRTKIEMFSFFPAFIEEHIHEKYNNKKSVVIPRRFEFEEGWVHYDQYLVEPIEWIYDKKTGLVISSRALIGGISYNNMNQYLNEYFIHEIVPSKVKVKEK